MNQINDSVNVIVNQSDADNEQSEVPEPSPSYNGGQMMSRRRARALAKQMAAAGIEPTK